MHQLIPEGKSLQIEIDSDKDCQIKTFRKGVYELIKNQLSILNKIVTLEKAGKEAFINKATLESRQHDCVNYISNNEQYEVVNKNLFQRADAYEFVEPRIPMIGRFLSAITKLAIFYNENGVVDIDGFALKNLYFWAQYPFGNIMDSLGCISSYCDAKCLFCFRYSSPLARNGNKLLSFQEAQTLIKYFNQDKGLGLPVPLHDTGEVFLNKDLLNILYEVRKKYPDVFINDLTTHGGHLTKDILGRLAELKPLFLVISLNSSELSTRKYLMKQKGCAQAITVPPALKDLGIQYMGSIVPWPSAGINNLEESIRYLDEHEPYLIRICLPSYTSLDQKKAPFSGTEFWLEVKNLVETIRTQINTPLLIQPSWYLRKELSAHVDGIIRNSPAAKAGLQFGDRIISIDGVTILNRQDARKSLFTAVKTRKAVEIKYDRNGQLSTALLANNLNINDDAYPYKPIGYKVDPQTCFGLHFIDGFPFDSVLQLGQILKDYAEAENILLFTTDLGKPLFVETLSRLIATGSFNIPVEKIHITVAPHTYWGGNIVIGDIHVVDDYISHIESLKLTGYHPDLVLIPSSFTMGLWGLDILGQSYLEIERSTGCTTHLIPTAPIKI